MAGRPDWLGSSDRHGGTRDSTTKEASDVIKRLLYGVLGVWLVKRYIAPRFGGGRERDA